MWSAAQVDRQFSSQAVAVVAVGELLGHHRALGERDVEHVAGQAEQDGLPVSASMLATVRLSGRRPHGPRRSRRRAAARCSGRRGGGGGAVAEHRADEAALAGTLLFASHVVGVQKDFISAMFTDGGPRAPTTGATTCCCSAATPGSDRWGLRPDSLSVASIDAETGETVLFGLPRNMLNFPFAEGSIMDEQFPDGYDCGGECELNSLSTWAETTRSLFKGFANPGVEATKEGVEGITGLKINYYAMVNLQGFQNWSTLSAGSPSTSATGSRSAASAARSPATSSPASASSTASRRCGSPARAWPPTTTRGWRARSA